MPDGTRQLCVMTNRFDAHQLRDPSEVLRPELHRVIASGIKVGYIAQIAKVHPKTLSGINSGRRKTVTVAVHGLILEALCKIQEGEVDVPDDARRPPKRAVVQVQNGTHCGYGHEFTPENVRWLPRQSGGLKRVCKRCEARRAKTYQIKKARQSVVQEIPADPAGD